MELKYIFYITVNRINGKFYFGVHHTNPDVFDGYIGCGIYSQATAREDFVFHKAVRKYGYENFKRTTIQIFPDTEEGRKQALALERTIVNPTLLKSNQCYNMRIGGGGGEVEICNKKIYMFALNGNYLRSFKNSRAGAQYLIDHGSQYDIEVLRKCIGNVCRGTSQSCENYYWSYEKKFNYQESKNLVKVAQYTLSGKFLRYYNSCTEANVAFNCDVIQAIVKKGSAGGYQWRYYTGDDSDISPLLNSVTKNMILPILMYKNGELVKEYDCIYDCIKENPNLKSSEINRVLKGKYKTHKGYSFKYKDEDIV